MSRNEALQAVFVNFCRNGATVKQDGQELRMPEMEGEEAGKESVAWRVCRVRRLLMRTS